jgi:hypothetical protein
MKTVISYEFEDGDVYAYNQIVRLNNSTRSYLALYEISEHLRQIAKYEHSGEVEECIESIRQELFDILENNSINLDNLE